ncbi:uncharacterized protein LOC106434851 [Brassica napus]|uniref:uncharacterized protein LOC106434851 n=1 Tax=Brassica napus TaxID=3708 RepID=UPI0006AA69FC|nr:uncharacterized protein LOC106434851 [Brassica napus]
MIPINSFLWILPLIAPMSVVLSEKTLRLMKPSSLAAYMAARTAKASATRGDEMNSCVEDPIIVLDTWGPEKFHANPALFLVLFQAASVLHEIELFLRGTVVDLLFLLFFVRALPVSSGVISFESKIRAFRDVQRNQRTQGRMEPTIPVGSKQTASLKRNSASLKSIPAAM